MERPPTVKRSLSQQAAQEGEGTPLKVEQEKTLAKTLVARRRMGRTYNHQTGHSQLGDIRQTKTSLRVCSTFYLRLGSLPDTGSWSTLEFKESWKSH